MLRSRMYLGEIHFDELYNTRVHEAIVNDRGLINSDSGSYRYGDTSANRCQRRAAVKADRVEEMVLDAGDLDELGTGLGRPGPGPSRRVPQPTIPPEARQPPSRRRRYGSALAL